MSIYVVIMAGGVGSRFYPMSTSSMPKQFLPLFSNKSMIRETYERVLPLVDTENILVSSNHSFASLIEHTLPEVSSQNLLLEPVGRNTGPALGLCALHAMQLDPDAIVISVHSDHFIRRESRFLNILNQGVELARKGRIVTLGITPDYPETGYGYIRRGRKHSDCTFEAYTVDKFVEKPDSETAKSYLRTNEYLWNAGMFIFQAKQLLDEMKLHCLELYDGLSNLGYNISGECPIQYNQLPSIAIDVAVMERSCSVSVIPCDIGWSDVGSFTSLYKLHDGDSDGNVSLSSDCDLYCIDSNSNLIRAQGSKSVALIGVSDLMIIDTEDCLLVGKLNRSQEVKDIQTMKSK